MRTAFLLLSVIYAILFLGSCVEPEEGCTDPFSSNYSLFADTECKDCCTYPLLNFTTSYLFGEDNNIDSSLYYNNAFDSYFKLRSFYLVASQFELNGDDDDYKVRSKTEDKTVSDDLMGIKFKNGSHNPGSIAIEDSIRMIRFNLGLPDELDNTNEPDLDYEVIELLNDSMYVDDVTQKFYKLILEVVIDSMPETTMKLGFADLDIDISENVVGGTTRGNRLNFQLSIDFMRLFNGVKFQSVNVEQEAKALISQNIADAIEVN